MLEGRESSGAVLAGSGSSYWSKAGSAGGKRELHSRRNNMGDHKYNHFLSFTLIKDDFTLHFVTILLIITDNRNNKVSSRC